MSSSNTQARIAVIAVHGVADQRPGDTARTLAELLVTDGPDVPPDQPTYRLQGGADLALRVPPLAPSAQAMQRWLTQPHNHDLPLGTRLAKALRQSTSSDLHREPPGQQQPDLELTDFLLGKALHGGMPTDVYDTRRLHVDRQLPGAAAVQPLHLYEMYWADLSRLSGQVPRILTEVFTLVSRLSLLGRDTVAGAAREFAAPGQPRAGTWHALDRVQAAADWLFSRVLAQLMLQLLVLTLVLVPLGWLATQGQLMVQLGAALAVLLPLGAWLCWTYWRIPAPPGLLLSAALGIAAGVALSRVAPVPLVGATWVLLLAAFNDWLLRICEARFPLTRPVGGLMALLSLGTVLAFGLGPDLVLPLADGTTQPVGGLPLFQAGALRSVEWLLLGTALGWIVMGPLLAVWLLLGLRCAGTHGWVGRTSVATGRLGLFASLAFFLTLVMATWALLHPLLKDAVGTLAYVPAVFGSGPADVAQVAADFLEDRYSHSIETFAFVAVLVFCVVAYLGVGLLPPVLAELRMLGGSARSLGCWLSRTYRWLDRVMLLLIAVAVVVTSVVAVDLLLTRLGRGGQVPIVNVFITWMRNHSVLVLTPLTLAVAAASITAMLTALGGLLSRYVPGLRAPLDAALDVDNHFREFPRKGIPRARIFSRYAALLQRMVDEGYERVVIVAHSQGSVLTAELLRYLQARAAQADDDSPAARLGRALAGRVHLMTAGCPLRQLYASRFPVLYPWVLQPTVQGEQDAVPAIGPTPASIGVQHWVNVYATGDYVGRWLWSRPAVAGVDVSVTMVDMLRQRLDVYDAQTDVAATRARLAQRAAFDVCLGAGAHTHYFEPGQRLVAGLVDALLDTPTPAAAAAVPTL